MSFCSPPPHYCTILKDGTLLYDRALSVLALKNIGSNAAQINAFGALIFLQPRCVLLIHEVEGSYVLLAVTNDFDPDRVATKTWLPCIAGDWTSRDPVRVKSGLLTVSPRLIWPSRLIYPLLMAPGDSFSMDLIEKDRRFNTRNPMYWLPNELRMRIYSYLYYPTGGH